GSPAAGGRRPCARRHRGAESAIPRSRPSGTRLAPASRREGRTSKGLMNSLRTSALPSVRERVPRDLDALHFGGPFAETKRARVAIEPLDRQLAHVAHAAEDLQNAIRDPAAHLAGVELGAR